MTLKTEADYQNLIPWQNADKPNFRAVVGFLSEPFADEQAFLAAFPQDFDLDFAIGAQLDVVGQWVGVSRLLPVPVANLYFSLGIASAGLGAGYWKGPYATGVTIQSLDDDTYRRLLRARILANYGKGTPASAQAALTAFFSGSAYVITGQEIIGYSTPDYNQLGPVFPEYGYYPTANVVPVPIYENVMVTTSVIVQDNAVVSTTRSFFAFGDAANGLGSQAVWYDASLLAPTIPEVDMSVIIGISGAIPSVLDLEVLNQNLIPVVSAGVRSSVVVTSVNGAPLFGLGVENQYVSGFGFGALGVPVDEYIDAETGAAA